jgi:hypothetical protein
MHMKKNAAANAVFALLIAVSFQSPALSAPDTSTSTKQDDVVVKKNADGTIETSDAPSARHSATSAPAVEYHLHNVVGTRRINGVLVRTNPDGSIETIDSDSAPAPSHRAAVKHTAAHKKAATPAKKQAH